MIPILPQIIRSIHLILHLQQLRSELLSCPVAFSLFFALTPHLFVSCAIRMHLCLDAEHLGTNILQRQNFRNRFSLSFPVFDLEPSQDSCQALLSRLGLYDLWEMGFVLIHHSAVELRRVNYGSCIQGLVCVGDIDGKIGEIGELGERELVLVVKCRVRQGIRHDTLMTIV